MNNVKTFVLLAGLVSLCVLAGQLLGGSQGLLLGLAFGGLMSLGSYFFSDRLMLRMYGAKVVTQQEAPELYAMVDRLRQRAGLPMPRLAITPAEAAKRFRDRPEPFARRGGGDPGHPQVHACG